MQFPRRQGRIPKRALAPICCHEMMRSAVEVWHFSFRFVMPPKKKTRVKDPNITKRQIVTKLELPTAELLIQLNIVAEKVFELPGSINKQYAK
jgi:hypothetical protein